MNTLQEQEKRVMVPLNGRVAEGVLYIPHRAAGIIIFSGPAEKKDHRLRNELVSAILNKEGFATLLVDFDLPADVCEATQKEQERLADELILVSQWVKKQPALAGLPVGYFGACAGVAAILRASMHVDKVVLVCRGGNPEAMFPGISKITAPVLLIVGEKDAEGLYNLKEAFAGLSGEKELKIVSGASRYFTELGKLGEVAVLASRWFHRHFDSTRNRTGKVSPTV